MNFPFEPLILLLLLGRYSGQPAVPIDGTTVGCPTCDVEHCPKSLQECAHGLVRDQCGCCKEGVCLLLEKEKCLNLKLFKNITETEMKRFGVCGEYLECVLPTDIRAGEIAESVCKCQKQEVSCGKDNVTYASMCELREAKAEFKHSGACSGPPKITFDPEVTSSFEHERFSLNCEAKGFPVPNIYWEFEGVNGFFKLLPGNSFSERVFRLWNNREPQCFSSAVPGDDTSIAVHNRGGPEPFTVSSWMMIEPLRQSDSGIYICVAKSSEGVARSAASVRVIQKNF